MSAGRVYVASGMTDEVLRFDAATGELTNRLDVDRRRFEMDEPHAVAASPDGRHLYVTVAHGTPTLWKYETADDQLVGRLSLTAAGAARIGITPDGKRAFVPDYDRAGTGRVGEVAVVRLHDLALLDQVPVCMAPHDAAPHPIEAVVAIVCHGENTIALLHTDSLAVVERWTIEGASGMEARPMNAVWSPEGDRLYVSLHHPAAVLELDRSGREIARIDMRGSGAQLALSHDGRRLAALDRAGGAMYVAGTEPLELKRIIDMPIAYPHGIALDDAGRTAFVTMEGELGQPGAVSAVDLESGTIDWTSEAGRYTLGAVYIAD